MKHESRYHFERHTTRERSVLVACWAVLFALGVVTALAPVSNDPLTVHAIGIAIACATGFLLVRSVRWATIDIYEDSVILRGLIRTTKLDRTRIDRFLVVAGLDYRAAPAVALAVKSTVGETRVFNDFASALDARSFSAESLVLELNARLGNTPVSD